MCGIAGLFDERGIIKSDLESMIKALARRGPDGEGQWMNSRGDLAFGHTRLAIIDGTNAGLQPMMSANKKYALVFNGEIYNFQKIRAKLSEQEGINCWRGSGDTEVLVNAFMCWGINKTLASIEGMFAIALYDAENNVLHLIRDQFGEKPLYYGWSSKEGRRTFLFASDLKAIMANKQFVKRMDNASAASFLRFGFVPDPMCIYESIAKLEPGTIFSINLGSRRTSSSNYINYSQRDEKNQAVIERDDAEVLGEFQHALSAAVRDQMVSDVPIGLFLSGGVDSALIASKMMEYSETKTKTFTIGVENKDFDESNNARAIANFLGTDHHELILGERDLLNFVPFLHDAYSEPFGDSSQIPTCLLSEFASSKVKVVLSGDGGDELFGGYNRYIFCNNNWNTIKAIPRPLRGMASKFYQAIPTSISHKSVKFAQSYLGLGSNLALLPNKIDKAFKVLKVDSVEQLHLALISHWKTKPYPEDQNFVRAMDRFLDPYNGESSALQAMMNSDISTYLSGDILVKVDRAAMYSSIENRSPFLNRKVYEFSRNLPLHFKIRNGRSKWLLKSALSQYLPSSLFDAPKRGFGVPIGSWLKGALNEWANDLFCSQHAEEVHQICGPALKKDWDLHNRGIVDASERLWIALSLINWREKYCLK